MRDGGNRRMLFEQEVSRVAMLNSALAISPELFLNWCTVTGIGRLTVRADGPELASLISSLQKTLVGITKEGWI